MLQLVLFTVLAAALHTSQAVSTSGWLACNRASSQQIFDEVIAALTQLDSPSAASGPSYALFASSSPSTSLSLATSSPSSSSSSSASSSSSFRPVSFDSVISSNALDAFCEAVFAVMENEQCRPTRDQAEKLIKQSPTFSHLVSLSSRHNTDQVLSRLRLMKARYEKEETEHKKKKKQKPKSKGEDEDEEMRERWSQLRRKVLFLTSARNHHVKDPKTGKVPPSYVFSRSELLQGEGDLVHFHFSSYLRAYNLALSEPLAYKNLRLFIKDHQWYSTFDEHLNTLYYGVSYIDAVNDRGLKRHINRVLQGIIDQQMIPIATLAHHTHPLKNFRRLAVISQFWFKRHSVYRTLARYAKALHESGFELDLLCIGPQQHDTDADHHLFTRVQVFDHVSDLQRAQDIALHVAQQDYGIVWYPAVGMDWPTILLSNVKLAPLTIASPGHSVSTFGSRIDYWLSGDEAEDLTTPPTPTTKDTGKTFPRAVKQYDETLVLLRGAGVVHNVPQWRLDRKEALSKLEEEADRKRGGERGAEGERRGERERDGPGEGERDTEQEGSNNNSPMRPLIINCPFAAQKINAAYVSTLRQIVQRYIQHYQPQPQQQLQQQQQQQTASSSSSSSAAAAAAASSPSSPSSSSSSSSASSSSLHPRPLLFRFYPHLPSVMHREVLMRNIVRALTQSKSSSSDAEAPNSPAIPVTVEVYADLPYEQYMKLLAEGDVTLESAPYGGCNTVVDALYVGQALVNWEGPRWNGRIGSAIVRRVSPSFAEQVVATSHQQYVNMTVRALTDPATRISLKRQALQADMDSLFGLSSPESVPREEDDFVEAVNYLIQNHQQKSKPRIILMSEVAKGTTTSQKRKEEL